MSMLEAEKLTQGPVNSPAKPYGEQIQLDRLKQALPQPPSQPSGGPGGAPGPSGPSPLPQPSNPRPVGGGSGPQGIPDALLAPGAAGGPQIAQMPQQQVAQAMTAQQRRLMILDSLAQSPNVAEATKEWAERVKRALIAGAQ